MQYSHHYMNIRSWITEFCFVCLFVCLLFMFFIVYLFVVLIVLFFWTSVFVHLGLIHAYMCLYTVSMLWWEILRRMAFQWMVQTRTLGLLWSDWRSYPPWNMLCVNNRRTANKQNWMWWLPNGLSKSVYPLRGMDYLIHNNLINSSSVLRRTIKKCLLSAGFTIKDRVSGNLHKINVLKYRL